MKKIILSLSCCILGLGSTTLFAQSGVVATGGSATGTGGSASFSIGQVFYLTPSSTTHNLIQGLQQPFEITVTGLEKNVQGIDLVASVFPNPSIEALTLKVENNKWTKLSYELYDESGKLLLQGKVVGEESKLDVSNLPSAYYFLKVSEENQLVKTFKILKSY